MKKGDLLAVNFDPGNAFFDTEDYTVDILGHNATSEKQLRYDTILCFIAGSDYHP
jgi:hypothetical protein